MDVIGKSQFNYCSAAMHARSSIAFDIICSGKKLNIKDHRRRSDRTPPDLLVGATFPSFPLRAPLDGFRQL